MLIRPFEERDRPHCHRIWREVGWMKPGEEPGMDLLLDAGRCLVVELNDEAECLVMASSADIRHLDITLPLSAVTGVTTSIVGRKQGLAARALAQLVANEAEHGAILSGLGMFEQGFYNRLGYGTTSYLTRISFDPAALQVRARHKTPRRLTKDDWSDIHANRLARRRPHGSVSIHDPGVTQVETSVSENGFGLGFRDDGGQLTHHIWFNTSHIHRGPYCVQWMAWRTHSELLELLSVIHALGDQVRLVQMVEPTGFVMQDLVSQPFKRIQISNKGEFPASIHSYAPYQFRICDLERCVAATRIPWAEVSFNLAVHDPIGSFLPEDSRWRGVNGTFRVELGPESHATSGEDPGLPTLRASIGAFTRLWMGARPATTLAVTDELEATPELLHHLDEALRMPAPLPDWDF